MSCTQTQLKGVTPMNPFRIIDNWTISVAQLIVDLSQTRGAVWSSRLAIFCACVYLTAYVAVPGFGTPAGAVALALSSGTLSYIALRKPTAYHQMCTPLFRLLYLILSLPIWLLFDGSLKSTLNVGTGLVFYFYYLFGACRPPTPRPPKLRFASSPT